MLNHHHHHPLLRHITLSNHVIGHTMMPQCATKFLVKAQGITKHPHPGSKIPKEKHLDSQLDPW